MPGGKSVWRTIARAAGGAAFASLGTACAGAPVPGDSMIGILIVAHDTLGESLIRAVTHVLAVRPPQFETLAVRATDDPLDLLPPARALIKSLDTGDGVLIFSDIYGATPCNLATKLLQPGRIEGVAGVNLPMLVRAF